MDKSSNISDMDAWAQLKAGDVAGLNHLYDDYAKRLMQYGLNRTDTDTAQDALQETFLAIWESRHALGNTDSPKNYLYVTYRRKLIKLLNDKNKVELTNDHHIFDLPDIQHEKSTETNSINLTIESLSVKQKEIIYLKYYQGMDYDEISEILKMNYQSVRNLMSRAMKAMRSKMSALILFIIFFIVSTNCLSIAL